ncbi:Inner membrane protein YhjD [Microbacterium lemovicicum]|uniref:Inner membrane protein YhjD n=1 Tax=Microbacterium lemovicicum TaxID=1072463 RepID=A0A3Q9IXH9_9MICO|nr:YihY/virulence factor BrkB family protein [Microbacterium lemovicicum]AZS36534.1 Inner membrane protein YhjD [Microbacterium lemovicicum]
MAEASPSPALIPRVIARALTLTPVRVFLLYGERRGPMLADSITYRTLFSVFAGVLLGFSVAAVWLAGNPVAWQALIDAVDSAIPGLVGEGGVIDPDAIKAPTGFTVAGVIALIGLLGAAIGAIGSLRTAIRLIAGKVHDDTLPVIVMGRNLLLAIALGGALAVSAAATFLATAGIGILTDLLGFDETSPAAVIGTRAVSVLAVFLLDAIVVAVMFRTLSGTRPPRRALLTGAVIGGIGLTVLQQLSGLFVGGATSNPLLGVFATLIALLLWINLSAQVILIASAWIVVTMAQESDRVHERFGAATFVQRRVRQAEASVRVATDELQAARTAESAERAAMEKAAAKAAEKEAAKAAEKTSG